MPSRRGGRPTRVTIDAMVILPPNPQDDSGRPAWARHLPAGVSPDSVDVLGAESLPSAWSTQWRDNPSRPVIGDPGGSWLDGRDLLDRTEVVAGRLAAAGVRRGDRMLLSGEASAHLVVAHCAALRMGLVVVPVNSAYSRPELELILGDAGAPGRHPRGERAPLVGSAARPRPHRHRRQRRPPRRFDARARHRDTGRSGAAAVHVGHHRHAEGRRCSPTATCWPAPRRCASPGVGRPTDRLVLCLPLFHVHGLGVGLHGTLLAGGSAVLLPRFAPRRCSARSSEAPPCSSGCRRCTPASPRHRCVDGSGALRLCVSGSAPLAADAARPRSASDAVRRVLERYGMTETVMLVSNPLRRRAPAGHGRASRCPGSSCAWPPRRRRRDPGARARTCSRGYWRPARRHRRRVHRRRLVPHRRHRRARRRRLPAHRRPGQGADHQRRASTSTRVRSRTSCAATRRSSTWRSSACRRPSGARRSPRTSRPTETFDPDALIGCGAPASSPRTRSRGRSTGSTRCRGTPWARCSATGCRRAR